MQRTRYKNAVEIIKSSNHDKYLLSREFDQQLENEVTKFGKEFPDTIPIIVFRRHDSYIASQYRRFVKNGFKGSFSEFFDVQNDQGYFKQSDLNFTGQIEILRHTFSPEPIVLIYEDMRKDPQKFVTKLAARMGATIDLKSVNFDRKHTSYSEKQLKGMQAMSKRMNMWKRRGFKNNFLNLFWRIYLGSIRYSTLYISKIIPSSWLSQGPLINPDELAEVKELYANDWENILKIAASQAN